jgi:hypothetical protein
VSNVIAWADDAALVEAAVELHHNLACPVVIHKLKLANVAVLLHQLQELDNHLAGRADQHLALWGVN